MGWFDWLPWNRPSSPTAMQPSSQPGSQKKKPWWSCLQFWRSSSSSSKPLSKATPLPSPPSPTGRNSPIPQSPSISKRVDPRASSRSLSTSERQSESPGVTQEWDFSTLVEQQAPIFSQTIEKKLQMSLQSVFQFYANDPYNTLEDEGSSCVYQMGEDNTRLTPDLFKKKRKEIENLEKTVQRIEKEEKNERAALDRVLGKSFLYQTRLGKEEKELRDVNTKHPIVVPTSQSIEFIRSKKTELEGQLEGIQTNLDEAKNKLASYQAALVAASLHTRLEIQEAVRKQVKDPNIQFGTEKVEVTQQADHLEVTITVPWSTFGNMTTENGRDLRGVGKQGSHLCAFKVYRIQEGLSIEEVTLKESQ